MAFQSTALIDSSIPRGEIKKIDRPSAFQCHSSQQLYVKLKTQLKFKLFQSDGAPQPMFHLIELWWKSDARVQSGKQMGWVFKTRLPLQLKVSQKRESCSKHVRFWRVLALDGVTSVWPRDDPPQHIATRRGICCWGISLVMHQTDFCHGGDPLHQSPINLLYKMLSSLHAHLWSCC